MIGYVDTGHLCPSPKGVFSLHTEFYKLQAAELTFLSLFLLCFEGRRCYFIIHQLNFFSVNLLKDVKVARLKHHKSLSTYTVWVLFKISTVFKLFSKINYRRVWHWIWVQIKFVLRINLNRSFVLDNEWKHATEYYLYSIIHLVICQPLKTIATHHFKCAAIISSELNVWCNGGYN